MHRGSVQPAFGITGAKPLDLASALMQAKSWSFVRNTEFKPRGIRMRFILASLALAAASLGGIPGASAQSEISIAVAGPMTGEYASFGAQFKAGAEAAVADINKAGGVLGKQLKLEVGDDACDPKQARSVAEQLAAKNVVFVAGHYCSGSSIPASDVYNEAGIIQISPGSTNPKYHRPAPEGWLELPRLRPRRPARLGGRQLPRHELQGQERRDPRRQDRLRQGPRRGDQEGDERGRQDGGLRRHHHGRREGLQHRRHQAQGGQDRRGLPRRLPHRGGPHHPPDARPGHEDHPYGRRRAGFGRAGPDRRPRGGGNAVHLLPRPAQEPRRG